MRGGFVLGPCFVVVLGVLTSLAIIAEEERAGCFKFYRCCLCSVFSLWCDDLVCSL